MINFKECCKFKLANVDKIVLFCLTRESCNVKPSLQMAMTI